jgi:hypothetical protein
MLRVGTTLVTSSIAPSLLLLVRALGSAAQVYRSLPRAVSKFSTTSTMTVLEATSTSATIRFELHEGYRPSVSTATTHEGSSAPCRRSSGSPAPPVHEECQADGAAACLYRVTWSRRYRWSPVGGPTTTSSRRCASSCRTCSRPPPTSSRATTSARSCSASPSARPPSVLAQGYLLACTPPTAVPRSSTRRASPRPRSRRSRPDCWRARTSAAAPSSSTSLGPAHPRPAGCALRRRAAGDARRASALGAYASHAAAALDLLTALEDSRRDGAGRRRCSRWPTASPASPTWATSRGSCARPSRRSSAARTPPCCCGSPGPVSCAPPRRSG